MDQVQQKPDLSGKPHRCHRRITFLTDEDVAQQVQEREGQLLEKDRESNPGQISEIRRVSIECKDFVKDGYSTSGAKGDYKRV